MNLRTKVLAGLGLCTVIAVGTGIAVTANSSAVSPPPTQAIVYTPCWYGVVQVTDDNTAGKPIAADMQRIIGNCTTMDMLNQAIVSLDPNNMTPARLANHDEWFFEHGYPRPRS